MKRILAALMGKVEKCKVERKVARVLRAIESAKDNAQDEIDRLDEKMSVAMSTVSDSTEVAPLINKLSDLIGKKEEQEDIIRRLEKVEKYINDEVDCEEK